MNILNQIILNKQKEVDIQSKIVPLDRLKASERLFAVRDFKSALTNRGTQIIAEIKRHSPSEGDILMDADPSKVARSYEKNGAAAISVLTDKNYFGGELNFIKKVRSVIDLPILRKDFIISEYQIWESFYAGADAILLIVDAIESNILFRLYELSVELGMHVLVESHTHEGIKILLRLKPEIIGVNCRNLKTMETEIEWFKYMIDKLPIDCVKVAESGIRSAEQLNYVAGLGYDAVLVGTGLMRTGSPGYALAKLLGNLPHD